MTTPAVAVPGIETIDHVSVLVADAEAAAGFYQAVLDLVRIDRPALGFPGVWLHLAGGMDLHLLQLPNPDPTAH
ncbi:MAG: VOC family protein, partial [Halothiobacillus sp.]